MGEKVEFDELEKLLGEIPDATSANPYFEEYGGSLDGRDLRTANGIQHSLTNSAQLMNNVKLSDEQSLASALGQLNITSNSNAFDTENRVDSIRMTNSIQFPTPNHHPYLMNPQSSAPCFHSPQLNHSHAVWRNLDQEHYYRVCQQNLYYQLEAPNFASSMVNQGQIFNSYGFPRCFKQLNLGLPSSERTSQQIFSEKNVVRTNGVSSLRSMKFGAVNCLRSCESRLLSWKQSSDVSSNRTHLMAKDQHGCRQLQRRISEGGTKEVEKIFVEIIDHIVELMTDSFGNYLVQKLLEACNEDQQTQILKAITRNSADLVRISCDMHGTRVVQKAIETLRTPEQTSLIVNSLKPCIVILMKNTNGNHVAQRCLQHLMPEYVKFLFDAAAACCVELATDRHGCCVLQKCLSYCGGKEKRRLIHEISLNALILSQDPYGNYVVQFIFDLKVPQATMNILNQLEGDFADLSMQKYSSNVVEKCLEHSREEHCGRIIQELIDSPKLDQVVQDPYGNYVVQAALKRAKGATKCALVEAIEARVPLLRTSPYGKKVLSCSSLKNNL